MAVNPDFRDLFAALNDANARYLLVGGYAVAFHGQPRCTKELDLWVEASEENARRVYAVLHAFGSPLQNLTEADLARSDTIFQIGVAPNRIDVITSIDGVTFAQAWAVREHSSYGAQSIYVISRSDLIQNQRTTDDHRI